MRPADPVGDLIGSFIDDRVLEWVRAQFPGRDILPDDFKSLESWSQVFGSSKGPWVQRGTVHDCALSTWPITTIESPQATVVFAGDRLYGCFRTDSTALAALRRDGDWETVTRIYDPRLEGLAA